MPDKSSADFVSADKIVGLFLMTHWPTFIGLSFDGKGCPEGSAGHSSIGSAGHSSIGRQRRSCCSGAAWPFRRFRHGGPWNYAASFEEVVRSRWPRTRLVPVLRQWSIPVFSLWRNIIDLDQAGLRCPTGIGSWADSVSSLQRKICFVWFVHTAWTHTSMPTALRFMASVSLVTVPNSRDVFLIA